MYSNENTTDNRVTVDTLKPAHTANIFNVLTGNTSQCMNMPASLGQSGLRQNENLPGS